MTGETIWILDTIDRWWVRCDATAAWARRSGARRGWSAGCGGRGGRAAATAGTPVTIANINQQHIILHLILSLISRMQFELWSVL